MDILTRRIKDEAHYIIATGGTVRQTAAVFDVGKSTVHKDMTERLPSIDENLYFKVREVLDKNLEERHIRGGIATKEHYRKLRE